MTFSGKIWLIIILKSHKRLGLLPISRRHIFGKTTGKEGRR